MKVHYYLSEKKGPSAEIYVRVTEGNSAWREHTGIEIRRDLWNDAEGYPSQNRRIHSDKVECARISSILDNITEKLYNYTTREKKWLKTAILSQKMDFDAKYTTIEESWNMMIREKRGSNRISEGTASTYMYAFRTISKALDGIGCNGSVVSFTPSAFTALRNELAKHVSQNSAKMMMTYVSAWWTWCCSKSDILVPMRGRVTIGQPVLGTPYYLTRNQRDDVMNAEMPTRVLEKVRDMFVLQCYIGCRISDLMSLTTDNIREGCIVYVAKKTSRSDPKTITVPLHPVAEALLKKTMKGERLVEYMFRNNYNNRIKMVLKLVPSCCVMVPVRDRHTGVTSMRPLYEVASSHMARRTFIGCLYEAGFRESDICSLSGHAEGSISIRRYRSVSDGMKQKMIDSL